MDVELMDGYSLENLRFFVISSCITGRLRKKYFEIVSYTPLSNWAIYFLVKALFLEVRFLLNEENVFYIWDICSVEDLQTLYWQ